MTLDQDKINDLIGQFKNSDAGKKAIKIAKEEEFALQKGKDALETWEKTDVSKLPDKYSDIDYEHLSSQPYYDAAMAFYTLVAYCDLNAKNNNKPETFNGYDDQRVIATASVWQDKWYKNLKNYRNSLKVSSLNVQRCIEYLKHPESNYTILSNEHRSKICEIFGINSVHVLNDKLKELIGDIPEINKTWLIGKFIYGTNEINAFVNDSMGGKPERAESGKGDSPIHKNHPLNLILYGPPGTGKTYVTKAKALEICLGKSHAEIENMSRKEINDAYQLLVDEGRVVFTTFHQSMSYEDFIEGIKPVPEEVEKETIYPATTPSAVPTVITPVSSSSPKLTSPDHWKTNVSYEVKDGIFKKICKKAELPQFIEDCKNNIYKEDELPQFIEDCKNQKTSFSTQGGISFYIEELQSDGKMKLKNIKGNSPKPISIADITKVIDREKFPDRNSIINELYPNRKEQQSQEASYILPIRDKFIEILKRNPSTTKSAYHCPYLLIIDEINRGNVAQIFGELITLIEESKRKGASDEQSATLPYSGDKFSVPSNLYILGTMNTADRSVEALDTALRRRFEFEEMMPRPELLSTDIAGVNLQELLTTINKRLEYLIDRDHTIGHSYLMGVNNLDDLKNAFKNKIIPQLQEYFYSDWRKIQLVLGNKFVTEKAEMDWESLFGKSSLSEEYDVEKKSYRIEPEESWDASVFKSIYEKLL